MALIHDIQADLLRGDSDIAPILLKFRLLAAKLGSDPLEKWIKYETEGYPDDIDIPDYRKLDIAYKGTFSGPFGSGISNAPIPSYLIQKFAGPKWVNYELRQSIAAVDKLISADKNGAGVLNLNASDLILILQGKVYENYACNSVEGTMSIAQLRETQHVVRSKLLELTIELQKKVPVVEHITIGAVAMDEKSEPAGKVNQIFNQTIHGNMTNVSNTGQIGTMNFGISTGNSKQVVDALVKSGISEKDAEEFSEIIASEKPESAEEPFGKKAKSWIAKNIGKAVDGTWKAGLSVATDVLKQATLSDYGLAS